MSGLLKQAKQVVSNWWLFVILGVFLIIGGIWVMMTPVGSYISLSIFFSAMVFVNGIFDIVFSISNRQMLKGWGWYLTGGILEVLIGVILVIHPGITMAILPFVLGFWLMTGAVSTISGAFDLKSFHVKGWGWVLVLGVLLMISGFMVMANPIFGSGAIVIITSVAIITYGSSYIIFGIKLKKVKDFAGDIKKTMLDNFDSLKADVLTAIETSTDSEVSKKEVSKKLESFKNLMN